MSIHRQLDYGQRLPVAFVDPIQQFISTLVSENFAITLTNPTTIRVVAGSDNDQVAIGISGKWRYNTSTVQRAHPGGAAGVFDVWVVCHDNSYTGTPEEDDTDYSFDLRILTVGSATPATGSGATFAARKVAQLVWDGGAITGIIPLVWGVKLHASTHQPGATDAIDYTLVNLRGTLASRPTASSINSGLYYLATDQQGGTIYQSTGAAWQQAAPGVTGALLPAAHASSHLAGGSDAIAWTTVHGYGNFSGRPTAGSTNVGFIYFAADFLGGVLYRSDGTAWTQITPGVTHAVTHLPGGLDPLDWVNIGSGHMVAESITWHSLDLPSFGAEVWGLTDGSAVSRSLYPTLLARLAKAQSGVRTAGSPTITGLTTTAGMAVGMPVEGAGINAGTTIAGIPSSSSLTLSSNATSSGTNPVQVFPHGNGNGSTTFNLPDGGSRGWVGLVLTGGHADVSGMGKTDGTTLAFRRPKHRHTNATALSGSVSDTISLNAGSLGLPAHTHSGTTSTVGSPNAYPGDVGAGGQHIGGAGDVPQAGGTQFAHAHTITTGTPDQGVIAIGGAPGRTGTVTNGSLGVSGLVGNSSNDSLDSAPYNVAAFPIRMA